MNFTTASLKTISVHYVGNKSSDEGLILSKKLIELEEELKGKVKEYFLNRFVSVFETHHFTHPSSLQYNEVFNVAAGIYWQKLFSSGFCSTGSAPLQKFRTS